MQLRAAYRGLLALRGLDHSDGRPLYRYRFQQPEYEGVKSLLRQNRQLIHTDSYGGALFVMFVAEWYRRDRTGGHWDWIRPLREIGISYEANSSRSALSYSSLKLLVEQGLQIWRRPLISRGQLLYSVVGEAGFPVAAIAESRLGTWLQRSVLSIEKGALPDDAVACEAARVSDLHTQVMFDAAVDLCRVAVTLRSALAKHRASTDDQLISQLDRAVPDWRTRLPFDIGDKGFFALFKDLMAAKGDADRPTKALRVVRRIRRSPDGTWKPYASVALSGEIATSNIAPSLASLLVNTDRARVIGRGAWGEFGHPLALIEKWRGVEREMWEVRPLQRETDHPIDLSQDVLLGAIATSHAVVEFVPEGGHAMHDPVIAFACAANKPQDANELQSIGSNSARSRMPWLVLAITSEAPPIQFDGEIVELGKLGTHRLIAFNGTAMFQMDAIKRVWTAGADRDQTVEVGVSGETISSTRGATYLGRPTLWLSDDRYTRRIPDRHIRWRPAGTRNWRRLADAEPQGSVDLAAVEQDAIVATVRVSILPNTFKLDFDRAMKSVVVDGHKGAVVTGTKENPLRVRRIGETILIDLSRHSRGQDIDLEFRWDTTAHLSIVDPFSEPVLLAPSNRPHPPRDLIAIGCLQGYRLVAPDGCKLHLEARNRTEAMAHASIAIHGSTPLMSLETQLRELLGSAATIDARVRLFWEGHSGYVAEIGWYDIAEGLFSALDGPSATLTAISILAPAQSLTNLAQQERWTLQALLSKEIGPGPWLVFGRRNDGAMIRPKVVPDPLLDEQPLAETSVLDQAIGLSTTTARRQLMAEWCADPTHWSVAETKKVVGMCREARRLGIPFNSFDILEVIVDHPRALPHILAVCSLQEERAAVLALQNEFPFLWCTTPIAAWIDAYGTEVERLKTRLSVLGDVEAATEAQRSVAKSLAQIGDLEAGVKSHAAVILRLQLNNHLDVIAMAKSDESPLRACADAFVARHGERRFQGEPGCLVKFVKRYQSYWTRYDETFWDPIVAPIVAAQMAAGIIPHSQQLTRRLRAAWHLDRDHFETSFSAAMRNEASGSAYIGGIK